MADYYSAKLSAERLQRVYAVAPPRVRQYLDAELAFVLVRIKRGDKVLELGCGYGRVLLALSTKAALVVGIDTAVASLRLGRGLLPHIANCRWACMNALQTGFPDKTFDRVVCIQNGISAFHVDQRKLIRESVRVTRDGGTVLFSSYSDKFWKDRLDWFERQSAAGLLGPIDHEKTRAGVIVCKDGFTAATISAEQFQSLCAGVNAAVQIVEVDNSSIVCEIKIPAGRVGALHPPSAG